MDDDLTTNGKLANHKLCASNKGASQHICYTQTMLLRATHTIDTPDTGTVRVTHTLCLLHIVLDIGVLRFDDLLFVLRSFDSNVRGCNI